MDRDALEQALRDERSLRLAAEARVAELTGHVAVWRDRAEARAERVERLEAAADVPWVRRAARAARRGASAVAPSSAPSGASYPGSTAAGSASGDDRHVPAASRSAAAGGGSAQVAGETPPMRAVVACVDVTATGQGADPGHPVLHELRRLELHEDGLAAADLVVVDAAGIEELDAAQRATLAGWAATPGRVPFVGVGPALEANLRDHGLTVDVWLDPVRLPPSVDARAHHPGAEAFDAEVRASLVARAAGDGVVLDPQEPGWGLHDVAAAWAEPRSWFLELAARGLAGWEPGTDPVRGGVAARRRTLREHASWVRVDQLLAAAGVPAPQGCDRVAAVLVSNRPDEVVAAIGRVAAQQGVQAELVLGLHGQSVTPEVRAALDRLTLPYEVLELPAELTLGACLNACIERTTAPVIAKIDDDDHYGPGHLEDGLQALRATGADLVGKAAQLTYVEGQDVTVLRRPRTRETFIDGTPTGATWVLQRALWERVRFPHRPRRVDALFLEGARAVGARVYANSPYDFCYVRSGGGHTWTADDSTFLAGAEPAWDGMDTARVDIDMRVVGL